ncbi:MAG TPA: hypothetical protein VH351_21520 [Bryobacteraceae bacterium]|nr:hypothetical protein [Bryobacteraceae bacterium]
MSRERALGRGTETTFEQHAFDFRDRAGGELEQMRHLGVQTTEPRGPEPRLGNTSITELGST